MEIFEIFGILAFVLVCHCLSKLDVLRELKRRIRKLEGQIREGKGNDKEIVMSKLIEGMIGKRCMLIRNADDDLEGMILDADEDWIKIEVEETKKNKVKKKQHLVRIDSVDEVQEIADGKGL